MLKTEENQYCEIKDISSKVPLQSFTILHVNIRSIKCNIDELKELLSLFKTSPDIIAVSETKLKANELCQVIVEGYNFIHEGTNTNAGGVGIFIKDYISYSLCNNLKMNIPNCEDIWIKLNLKNLNNCIVGTIYRHPYQIMKKFQEKLENTVEYLNDNKDTYYVAGDLNINLFKSNSKIKNYVDMIYSHGCIPLITHPIRITKKKRHHYRSYIHQ